MNTPRKKRRHQWSPVANMQRVGVAFAFGLFNPDYATQFACILTEFEHLESKMPFVLAILLGMGDERSAGYLYRTLRNASIRYEVMAALLEKAPQNIERDDDDDILAEYNALRLARNAYVHGLWFTETRTKKVVLARRDEHGFAFLDAEPEPIEELNNVLSRIRALSQRVSRVAQADLPQIGLPQGSPPRSGEPKPN